MACGDGWNDVDMMRWAGLGVAVAEASADVRATAQLVVPRDELGALFGDGWRRRRAAQPAGAGRPPKDGAGASDAGRSEGGARRVRRRLLGVLVAPALARRLPRAGDLDTLSPRAVQHLWTGTRDTHPPSVD